MVLFGYYGRGNLGDEANLRQIIGALREAGISGISVISADPAWTAAEYQVRAVAKYDLSDIIREFKRSRWLVGGGGALLQDASSRRSILYYTMLVWLARRNGLRIFLYGQGIGPLRTWLGKLAAKFALDRVEAFSIRDPLSLEIATELKVVGPQRVLTAEPLLALEPLAPEKIGAYWSKYPCKMRERVGLVVNNSKELKVAWWFQLLEALQMDEGMELFLLTTDNRDQKLAESLTESFGITYLPTCRDGWTSLQAAAAGLDLVVSARLHGLVAGVIEERPVFGLAIDSKLEGFCDWLKLPYWLISARQSNVMLIEAIRAQLGRRDAYQPPGGSLWRASALENRELLKRFIAKG